MKLVVKVASPRPFRHRERSIRRYVPAVLAVCGWALLVIALITQAKNAWAFSAIAYAWAWNLRGWAVSASISWVYVDDARSAGGTADTIEEAHNSIAALITEKPTMETR